MGVTRSEPALPIKESCIQPPVTPPPPASVSPPLHVTVQEVLARIETQLRLFMGEVTQLQEAAERNVALLSQILPPHVLSSLKGGNRVLVEKFPDV